MQGELVLAFDAEQGKGDLIGSHQLGLQQEFFAFVGVRTQPGTQLCYALLVQCFKFGQYRAEILFNDGNRQSVEKIAEACFTFLERITGDLAFGNIAGKEQ